MIFFGPSPEFFARGASEADLEEQGLIVIEAEETVTVGTLEQGRQIDHNGGLYL